MRKDDIYLHFKGSEYVFEGVALPLTTFSGDKTELRELTHARDAQTIGEDEIKETMLYEYNGLLLVERETAHVVYREKNNKQSVTWVREVDDFFGFKQLNETEYIKRFVKQ